MNVQPETAQAVEPTIDTPVVQLPELTQADVEQHDREIVALEKSTASEITNDIQEAVSFIEQQLDTLEKSAREQIGEILTAHTARAEEAGADLALSDEHQKSMFSAQLLLKNVHEIRTQQDLLAFIASARVSPSISQTVGLVKKEFAKFRRTMRTYKIEGFSYDSVFSIITRTPNNEVSKEVTSLLFYFLRFLNHLKSTNKLAENLIYARFTSTIISTSLLAGKRLTVGKQMQEIVNQTV